MKIDVRSQDGGRMVLALKGDLDRDGARKLTRFLLGRDRTAVTSLELDLGTVNFLGLSAIAALHELCSSLAKQGGTMALVNVSKQVESALSRIGKTPCWTLQNPDH